MLACLRSKIPENPHDRTGCEHVKRWQRSLRSGYSLFAYICTHFENILPADRLCCKSGSERLIYPLILGSVVHPNSLGEPIANMSDLTYTVLSTMTMREEKRKRLEGKGWKVGGVKEFLNLSPQEVAYIELKLKLADGLRKHRRRRRLTQIELAWRVRSSQSRVAKMEAGDPSVSLDLLVRSLLALGASGTELAKIVVSKTESTT